MIVIEITPGGNIGNGDYGVYISQLIRFARVCSNVDGERTKAHWDKSPLGQKPTGQYPTGQKPTAKFGRVDKSPLF